MSEGAIIHLNKNIREPKMKIKFSHKFTDHTGKEMMNGAEVSTLKNISIDCLMYPTQTEFQSMGGSEKVKRHDLGVKILNNGDNAELTVEECSTLKRLIGERYLPVVVTQSWALIDGKELPKYGE